MKKEVYFCSYMLALTLAPWVFIGPVMIAVALTDPLTSTMVYAGNKALLIVAVGWLIVALIAFVVGRRLSQPTAIDNNGEFRSV